MFISRNVICTKRSGRRTRAITVREEYVIFSVTSNLTLTARKIMTEADIQTNVRNLQ